MNSVKNKSRSERKSLTVKLKPLFLMMAAAMPSSALADIIADATEARRPGVAASANGTPLININDPNNNGISHNKYAEFDVGQQGIIFNNSMQDGSSKTGGFVIKNNQLSREAQVILNEVTGAKGSYLNGSIEVFGRKADVIIANENGIRVNGVSTVNANNLTLSTGKVNFNQEGDIRLAVERGNVSLEGTGINTAGLSYFDIVSRSATLSGEIAGTAELKVVTGLNDYNTGSRTHSVRSKSGNDKPQVAISGSHLGSMYGSRIQLISTETGAGVTHTGSIVGSNGIEITADGDIRLANVASKTENVTIAGQSIVFEKNAATGISGVIAQGDVVLTALAELAIKADIISETGIIRINAGSLLQSAANLLAKNNSRTSGAIPAIQINVAGRYSIVGTLYALDSSGNRIENAQVTLSQGKYVVKVGSTLIEDAIVASDASVISNSGDVAINAADLENQQALIGASKGTLIFNLTDTLLNNGIVQANGSIELQGRRLKNSGVFTTTDSLKLTLGSVENSGGMTAKQIALIADNLNNKGIIVAENGDLSVKLSGGDTNINSGTLQASRAIKIESDNLQNDGVINAQENVDITTTSLANSGTLQAGSVNAATGELADDGVIVINAKQQAEIASSSLVNSGTLQAGNVSIATGELTNAGVINAKQKAEIASSSLVNSGSGTLQAGNVSITTGELTNAGVINAKQQAAIASSSLANSGTLQAATVSVDTDALTNDGVINAQENVDITTTSLVNSGSGTLQAGNVSITTGELTNAGVINAKQKAEIASSSLVNSSSGTLQAGSVGVETDELTNDGNIVSTTGNVALQVNAESRASNQGIVQSAGSINLDAKNFHNEGNFNAAEKINMAVSNSLKNNGDIFGDNIAIGAQRLENNGDILAENGQLSVKVTGTNDTVNTGAMQAKNTTVTTSGALINQGSIAGVDALDLTAESLANSSEIISHGEMALTAESEIVNSGSEAAISAGKNITIAGKTKNSLRIKNSDGAVIKSIAGDINISDVKSVSNTDADILTNNTLTISNTENVTNENGHIQAETVQLSNLSNLSNVGSNANIMATGWLNISEVENIENTEGVLSSHGDLTVEKVKSILNMSGSIAANGNVKFTSVNLLKNEELSKISALYGELFFNTVDNLRNLSGSLIEAGNNISISGASYINNSDKATIQSMGDIKLSQTGELNNTAVLISSLNLILEGIDRVVNKGEYAILQGLDIVISSVSSIINQDNGTILAEKDLKLSNVINLLNDAAGFIQANTIDMSAENITNRGYESQIVGLENVSLVSKKFLNDDQAGIFSENNLSITADSIVNNAESILYGANYALAADSINNQGIISSDSSAGKNSITTASFDNSEGSVGSRGDLTISTAHFDNSEEGSIFSDKSLTLNIQGDFNNNTGDVKSSNKFVINATGDITIDRAMESWGSVHLSAGNIYNNHAIVSATDIYLTATKIVNNVNSLIYSMRDMFLTASDTLLNKINGNIMSQREMTLQAGTIHNQAGVIRSEGDMRLDANRIHNQSIYRGEDWDYSLYEVGSADNREGDGWTWGKNHGVEFNMPGLASDLALDARAEISSASNLLINQNISEAGVVNNEGGLIQAKGNIEVRGDIYNAPKYSSINMDEYLKTPLASDLQIILYYYSWSGLGASKKPADLSFNTVYDMLDYIFGSGNNFTVFNGDAKFLDSDSRAKFSSTLKILASKHTLLNTTMNKLFGEQWKATSFGDLSYQWVKLASGVNLKDSKIYFMPAEKAAIVAGKDFTHKDGSFNNGIASELSEAVITNQVVDVTIGEQEIVSTIEQGYEVNVSQKNIAEISMGISTLPTISALNAIKGLFSKSSAFIDYLVSLATSTSGSISTSASIQTSTSKPGFASSAANVQSGAGASNVVIPVYDTRPPMIDQSQYLGSEYFFNAVGYTSDKPVIVIGDNYYTTELIRRQLNESVGTFFAVKYNLESTDLVQMLFDHAGELVSAEENSSFVVGKALTKEQQNGLEKDIVWFVNEYIDGIEVLVPRIYLARQTIAEIDVVNKTGTAITHAGGNVSVDADAIQNANAVISAGNNVQLEAEGNITNVSSGMNAGIKAGGSVDIASTSGDIVNSGSQITAGKDISLKADEGNIELIASVGRGDYGTQSIGAYDDGLSAGDSITMQAKEIDITGIALEGGESEESEIRITSTEGNVNFNDVHEIKSSYDRVFETTGALSHRTEETTEVSATSKTNSVNTGGKFVVDAAKDAVFTGGEYNASSGEITAGEDVTFKTSQDHAFKEHKVTESSFEFGYKADVPGLTAIEENSSTLDGHSSGDIDYESGGSQQNMSASNTKRPGAAATADSASFHAGLKQTEETTTTSSTTNKNASFNFSDGADVKAGNTLDIGGMDLAVGESATADLKGGDIISTKYEDVSVTHTESKESFIGVKGEAHSALIDSANKHVNRVEKASGGMEIDGVMTAVEVGGDVSNVILNDAIGGSVSAGWTQTKDSASSETRSENINNISGGTINFNSDKDTSLKGVNINAGEVNVNAGGDFSISAAESSTTESSSNSTLNAGLAMSAGVSVTGSAGVGSSYDASGSTTSSDTSSTSYTNSEVNAGSFNVNAGGDMNMAGASVVANDATLNVGGDLNITSVQDTSQKTGSKSEWGASVGIAVSTSGVIPTVSASGGGGSESHTSNVTQKQSGISTTGELNVVTGGDLNLTGSHLVSESQAGSVDVGGQITANDLVDNVDSGGTYGGGGGGISYKGMPTGSFYVDTLDKVHYKEEQHSTINVGITNGEVTGNLNTDADKQSTVTEDTKVAGNNISYTVTVPTKNKKNKASDDTDAKNPQTPTVSDNTSSSTQTPGSSAANKPQTPSVSDNTGSSTQTPGSSAVNKPQTPSVSDNTGSSTQTPGSSAANKPQTPSVSDNTGSSTQKPGSSAVNKPQTPSVSDNTSSSTQKPGSSAANKPQTPSVSDNTSSSTQKPGSGSTATDTVDGGASGSGAQKWPTVQPVKPIVGGPGSASRPDGNNSAGNAKPANNSPAQNATQGGGNTGGSGADSATQSSNSGSSGVKKWPTVQPAKPIVGGPGSASRPDGNNSAGNAKPANNSPAQNATQGGGNTGGSGADSATQSSNSGSSGVKKWPTVQPAKPIVGGPGSASRPDGNNSAGNAKPANNSPAQNATQGGGSGATNSSNTGGSSENSVTPASNSGSSAVKKWPTVVPVKPIVGGTGSATRPSGASNAGSRQSANGSPAQNAASAVQKPAQGKWKTLMDNQTIDKPIKDK